MCKSQPEYISYCQDVEETLHQLETSLHDSDSPEEIITRMLIAAYTFYDGDWAGIMEADLTMKIWSTFWWHNRRTCGMTPNHFHDLEDGEYLVRWVDALVQGTAIIIEDIEELANSHPQEYAFLKTNGVRTLIAVPFWKRPTGFLIVRNPKRYVSRSSLLQMMAFVAVSSINEKRLMDSINLKLTPATIQTDSDIIINLFGGLQIITNKGVLTDEKLKSPKRTKLIVYLLLHSTRPASPYEIVRDLWPNDDIDSAGTIVKNLVYRLQQSFSLISEYRLIESTPSGYRLNPGLNIQTDLQMFEDFWNKAQVSADLRDKGHLLKKAIEIYKQGPMVDYSGEHWYMPTLAHYNLRYAGVVNQLLYTLDVAKDYICIYEYANIAMTAIPDNVDVYYWLIYAMYHLGMGEIARNELKAAQQVLIENDYADLINRLHKQGF